MADMQVLFPGRILEPYIEAYYVSSSSRQTGSNPAHFPAVSTGYIKFSPEAAIVTGQSTRPAMAEVSPGSRDGFGVKLRAGALPALFGIPASEVTDRVIPLEGILGNRADELTEQIADAPTPSTQVQRFEKAFMGFIQRRSADSHLLEQQALAMLRQSAGQPVSKLAEGLGYSPRHFQRKLNDFAGLSPRLYRRITRFERAVELIQVSAQHGTLDWSALAAACGYNDQAHFIRDFHRFAGQTPVMYLGSLKNVS